MSGQFQRGNGRVVLEPHTHVVVTFQQGADLRFVDPRTFGEMFVTGGDELGKVKELQHIAIDPLDQVFVADVPVPAGRAATKMKQLLMDQKFISGLGNIYSDEVLFRGRAPIRPRVEHVVVPGGPTPLSRDPGDAAGGDQAAGDDVRRRGLRRPVREAGRVPGGAEGLRTEGEPCRRCRTPIRP